MNQELIKKFMMQEALNAKMPERILCTFRESLNEPDQFARVEEYFKKKGIPEENHIVVLTAYCQGYVAGFIEGYREALKEDIEFLLEQGVTKEKIMEGFALPEEEYEEALNYSCSS